MSSKKYPVEKSTREKIKELFAYRKITDLLTLSNMAQDEKFIEHLMDVQYKIYMLDGYLESQWDLDGKEIKGYWKEINHALQLMGFKKSQIASLTEEIEDYEHIERNCRKDKWPTRESFKKFYTTKSCDVRLIRHLIYAADPDLTHLWKEKSWRYFDLITEIHDDIEDLEEDIKTYNGNRFLISILRKGAEKTRGDYEKFLLDVTGNAQLYFKDTIQQGKNKELAGWTAARSKETIHLLNRKFTEGILDQLADAYLLAEMN